MKRITVLSFLFLIVLSTNVFAARWEWVTSNDSTSVYIDSSNVAFQTLFDHITVKYIDCYVKYEYAEENDYGEKYSVQHLKFSLTLPPYKITNIKMCMKSYASYDSDDHLVSSESLPYEQWMDIMPGTFAEAIFWDTWKYYRRY